MSLFEVYDSFTFFGGLSLNWGSVLFFYLLMFGCYWCCLSGVYFLGWLGITWLWGEFGNFLKFFKIKFSLLVFIVLFIYILLVNVLGLIPYVFSCSSQLVFALSLGMPVWLGVGVVGWWYFTNSMFIHLIPVGTPLGLMSFMVFIETISNLIRPWSLSIRLMANIVSGHLLMSLLGGLGAGGCVGQFVLFGFEFFVCFIQAYVFASLLVLYSSEI